MITITGNVVDSSNLPPIADAGPDQTVVDTDHSGDQPVTLDGSQSHDPDGTITDYNWSEGPTMLAQGPSASTPTVTLAVGVHTITLLVTDDMSATATDTVVITVSPGSTCGSADFNHDEETWGPTPTSRPFSPVWEASAARPATRPTSTATGTLGPTPTLRPSSGFWAGGPC